MLDPTLTIHLKEVTNGGNTTFILEAIKTSESTLYADGGAQTVTYDTAEIDIDVLVVQSGQLNVSDPPEHIVSSVAPDVTVKPSPDHPNAADMFTDD